MNRGQGFYSSGPAKALYYQTLPPESPAQFFDTFISPGYDFNLLKSQQ